MTTQTKEHVVNGVPLDDLNKTVQAIKSDPSLAQSRFHITNRWISGGHSRSTIKSFYGAGRENQHKQQFRLEADEPEILAGTDMGANPVEHLLNALAGCLTGAMVYHAALRGIELQEVESEIEGNIDLQGFMGLSKDVRKGYQKITVRFKVKTDPKNLPRLRELAEFSPVYDVTRNGTDVELIVEAK